MTSTPKTLKSMIEERDLGDDRFDAETAATDAAKVKIATAMAAYIQHGLRRGEAIDNIVAFLGEDELLALARETVDRYFTGLCHVLGDCDCNCGGPTE